MSWLTRPFDFRFFELGLIAGMVVGAMCGALGCFVVLRRMAYLGHGLSYGILGGVAVAALLGANPYLGAAVATVVSGFLIDRVRRLRGLGADTAIAIVSTTAFAVGVAVISADRTLDVNTDNLLFGNILGLDDGDVITAAVTAVVVGAALFVFYKPLVFVTYDPEVAAASGVPLRRTELLLNVLVGAAVVVSLRVVGVLLVTAALVLPAALARLVCRTFGGMLITSAVAGAALSAIGLYISFHADLASGPAIVLAGAGAFVIVASGTSLRRSRNRSLATRS